MAIRVLAPEVSERIAAGEVIERPASVVKELVENALDAQATAITIEVQGGGLRLLRVQDNGLGIPLEELELAFQRYATSKIIALSDLGSLTTLGFRGEALPSIAAAAEVEVLSRPAAQSLAGHLVLRGGRAQAKEQRGAPQGTTVTVRHLFRGLPARLKFLKSPATELGHLQHLVSQYGLAYPEVRFRLIVDGRLVLNTSGSGNLHETIARVCGLELAQQLLGLVAGEQATLELPHLSGYVSPPGLHRANRRLISFFVNRRWVQSRLLTYALEEAYQGVLPRGRHPIAFVNLCLPPSEVDVNVHPTKAEVRFRDDRVLFALVQRAVRATLVAAAPVPQWEGGVAIATAPEPEETPAMQGSLLAPILSEEVGTRSTAPTVRLSLPILRVLGQVSNTYIIAEGPDGVYLVDQHAAHERVLYERLRSAEDQGLQEPQGLLEPVLLELMPTQRAALAASGEALSQAGFLVEEFGRGSYLLRAVPAVLAGRDAVEALRTILDELSEGSSAQWPEQIARTLACHSAVRAGQTLDPEEMRQMIRDLEAAHLPRTCPHGRPTMIHLSAAHLERQFGRR